MGIDPKTAWKHYGRFVPVTGAIEKGSARDATEKEAKQGPGDGGDVKTRLKLLKELREDGLISEEDLVSKRRDILGEV